MSGNENTNTEKIAIKKVTPENFNKFIELIEKLAEYEKLSHPHPMVRQTALKSRANFITSMNKTLQQTLPEDPDQLLQRACRADKIVLQFFNMKNRQGKYLHPTFPEEMKDLKSSLDMSAVL